MDNIGNPQTTIEIIQAHQFRFQKKFGQNFLIDNHVLSKILTASQVTKEDFVLEIGPGIGTLTQQLALKARAVAAVEIDGNLIPILRETLKEYQNVTVYHEDILKLDLMDLVERENHGKPIKVVANLPYYITTPIVMGLFEAHIPLDVITVMVQKELAERMRAKPGTKDYGALSLAIQYYADVYLAANVPRNCFMPRPNVDSAVVRLTRHDKPPVQVEDEAFMFACIRAAFNQRRKTLANSLHHAGNLSLEKNQIGEALEQLGLSQAVRGEALSLEQFAGLSNLLYTYGN